MLPLGLRRAIVAAACDAGAAAPTPPIVPGASARPREVNIIAKDYSFLPDAVDLVAGETVLLHVINGGLEVHEAVIGDAAVQDAWEVAEAATAGAPPGPDAGRQRPARTSPASGSSSRPASGSTSSGRCRPWRRRGGAWVVGCHIPGHWARGMQVPVRWVARRAAPRERRSVVRSAARAAERCARPVSLEEDPE